MLFLCMQAVVADEPRGREEDYYRLISISTPKAQTDSRSAAWKAAPEGLVLEVSGMCKLDGGRLGVTIRKGEVWILGGVYDDPPSNVTYQQFASGLHEPLGLIWHNGEFIAAQRTELTAMRDTDGDNVADVYRTLAKGWGVTGHYHEYAYGPKLDGQGNLWFTLNMGLGLKGDQLKRAMREPTLKVEQGRWRGWAMQVGSDGKLKPIAAGMRSPSGLGANAAGDMFYTDQQGNWVGTNTLHHLRPGIFTHHPESLASQNIAGAPFAVSSRYRTVCHSPRLSSACRKWCRLPSGCLIKKSVNHPRTSCSIVAMASSDRFLASCLSASSLWLV